ncbi:hypothetical protein MFM001_35680 [Mycobacterium sp. MFM001]|nr:hypothetical protein MFM001_35680 [Mycobacterium sp. MFM001]
MSDQVVGDLAEMLGGQDGVAELIEHVGVHSLDGIDQFVKADRMGNGCRIGHAVNSRLTEAIRQPQVDGAGRRTSAPVSAMMEP